MEKRTLVIKMANSHCIVFLLFQVDELPSAGCSFAGFDRRRLLATAVKETIYFHMVSCTYFKLFSFLSLLQALCRNFYNLIEHFFYLYSIFYISDSFPSSWTLPVETVPLLAATVLVLADSSRTNR